MGSSSMSKQEEQELRLEELQEQEEEQLGGRGFDSENTGLTSLGLANMLLNIEALFRVLFLFLCDLGSVTIG